MPKQKIIEALGERELLVPGLVGPALAANDRVKYLLTLLQSASVAADGASGVTNLREERLASGVDDPELDRVVPESRRVDGRDGWYRIPGADALASRAIAETQTMLAPLGAAGLPAASDLDRRVVAVADRVKVDGDLISADAIARLTAGCADDGDSLHLVVMDAHRELNRLQAAIATESIDGARVHDVRPNDRRLIEAFMKGLRTTQRRRFDHPGLATIGARSRDPERPG